LPIKKPGPTDPGYGRFSAFLLDAIFFPKVHPERTAVRGGHVAVAADVVGFGLSRPIAGESEFGTETQPVRFVSAVKPLDVAPVGFVQWKLPKSGGVTEAVLQVAENFRRSRHRHPSHRTVRGPKCSQGARSQSPASLPWHIAGHLEHRPWCRNTVKWPTSGAAYCVGPC
jgi:hypothetical protein